MHPYGDINLPTHNDKDEEGDKGAASSSASGDKPTAEKENKSA
jgi:hypothetical protein